MDVQPTKTRHKIITDEQQCSYHRIGVYCIHSRKLLTAQSQWSNAHVSTSTTDWDQHFWHGKPLRLLDYFFKYTKPMLSWCASLSLKMENKDLRCYNIMLRRNRREEWGIYDIGKDITIEQSKHVNTFLFFDMTHNNITVELSRLTCSKNNF